MSFPRVAVTGLGVVSSLGYGAERTFARLVRGERGIGPLTLFDPADCRARVAAEVPDLDVLAIAPRGETEWSRTDALALLAAREALVASGPAPATLGVSVGGTTGGMFETEAALLDRPLSPLDPQRPRRLLDHPLDRTARRLAGVFGARLHATSCAACASGAVAVARAVHWLEARNVERVIAGGVDGLCRLTFFGFDSLAALDPEPCRPFDRSRRGLTLGEGAGFLALELEATARARGADILGFLSGAGVGAEAHHITHPEPSGARAARMIESALAAARLAPSEVGYVNAHGTGTPPNDAMEAKALRLAFGDDVSRLLVSSSKGQIGHTLGAAGAIEAAITVLALARGVAPPTVGLAEPEDAGLCHVVGEGKAAALTAAASCSFGFGGTGCVLVFERSDAPDRNGKKPPSVGTRGSASGDDGVRWAVTGTSRVDAGVDPLSALDPERSRRFDRGAAFVAAGAEAAIRDAGATSSELGLVSGSAFGSVERSVEFVRRALGRGVRRANPAEFPHLVASGATGNASIYLGLVGPAVGVVHGDVGAEASLELALSLLSVTDAAGFVAGAAEATDPVVTNVLGALRGASVPAGETPRGEGGAFLLVESPAAARGRGGRVRALLERPVCVRAQAHANEWPTAPKNESRAKVVIGALSAWADRALEASSWRGAVRHPVLGSGAFHEAVGALALVAGVELVERGEADEVLVANGIADELWLTRLVRPEALP